MFQTGRNALTGINRILTSLACHAYRLSSKMSRNALTGINRILTQQVRRVAVGGQN